MSTPANPMQEALRQALEQSKAPPPTRAEQGQPSAGPPRYTREPLTGLGGFARQAWLGAKSELASILQIPKNVSELVIRASEKYSDATDMPLEEGARAVYDWLDEMQQGLLPSEDEASADPGISGRVARGLGAAPIQLIEYGLATLLTKRPALAFALIDSAKEMHHGAGAALKAGAIGAVSGKLQGAAGKIVSLPKRAAAGAAIGAATGLAGGGNLEDVVAGGLMGGGFGAAFKETPPKEIRHTTSGVKPDTNRILQHFTSPSIWSKVEPEAQKLVYEAEMAGRIANHLKDKWEYEARAGMRGVPQSQMKTLIEHLDDPRYDLDNLPPGDAKMKQAYTNIRTLLEEVRQHHIKAQKEAGLDPLQASERALFDVLKAEDPATFSPAEKAAYESLRKKDAMEDWGIVRGFFPHSFGEAAWAITYDGKPLMNGWLARNKKEANERMAEFLKLNPQADDRLLNMERMDMARSADPLNPQERAVFDKLKRKSAVRMAPEELDLYRKLYDRVRRTHTEFMGPRFFGHLQKRKETPMPGWVMDEQGLYDYLNASARYVTMAPMRPKLNRVTEIMQDRHRGTALADMWNGYVDQIEGRPGKFVSALNEMWLERGGSPHMVERGLGLVRGVEALAKLGFSPVTAFANLFQIPQNCVDAETEALTQHGWKKHSELIPGEDKIVCYDIGTDTCHWGGLNNVYSYAYDGMLCALEGHQISSRTTVGHRWAVSHGATSVRYEVTNDLEISKGQGNGEKRHCKLAGIHNVPLAREVVNLPVEKIYSDAFVRLCAWIATEGTFSKDSRKGGKRTTYGKVRAIEISQSSRVNPGKLNQIRELLQENVASFNEREPDKRTGVVSFRISAADSRKFLAIMPDKVPGYDFLFRLTREQVEIFLGTLIDGDGCRRGKPLDGARFSNTNKSLVDVFHAACCLIGKTARVSGPFESNDHVMGVKFKKSPKLFYVATIKGGPQFGKFARVRRAAKPPEYYKGTVWCPSVDSTFWLARRNGTVYVTGNTVPVIGFKWALKGFEGLVKYYAGNERYRNLVDNVLHVRDAVTKAEEQHMLNRIRLYYPRDAKRLPAFALDRGSRLAMLMFKGAEDVNRIVTSIGAFERAKSTGMSDSAAAKKALEVEMRTQFSYSPADTAKVFSNPILATSLQFRKFWQKQLEFIYGMGKKDTPGRFDTRTEEMAKYLLFTLAGPGLVGALGAETVSNVLEALMGEDYMAELKKQWPNASRGISGLVAGIDTSRSTGHADWFTAQAFSPERISPLISDTVRFGKWAFANPGRDRAIAWEQFKRGAVPQARRIADSGLAQDMLAWFKEHTLREPPQYWDRKLRDPQGRLVAENITDAERYQMLAGVTPKRIQDSLDEHFRNVDIVEKERSLAGWYIDRIAAAINAGNNDEASRIAKEAYEAGIPDPYRSGVRRAKETSQERTKGFAHRQRNVLKRAEERKNK